MAVDEVLVTSGHGNVDVQVGGPGQSSWKYLSACASLDGPSVPREGTEVRYCQDSQRSGRFTVSTTIRTAAGLASGNLMTKLGKVRHLENLDCPFSLRARFALCGAREDPTNFDPIMVVFSGVNITSEDYGALVAGSPDDNDEILITSPWTAEHHYWIKKVTASRAGSVSDLGDVAINDWAVCGSAQCAGYCGGLQDNCTILYGVSDKDTAPYAWPNIVQGIKEPISGTMTWQTSPIIGLDGDAIGVECAGNRVIVFSVQAVAVAYNDTYTDEGFLDKDAWNVIPLAHTPAANPNALYARTSQEVWLACSDGYIGKSVNGGATWSFTQAGTSLSCVYAYDANLVYAGGPNGEMVRSMDGGQTWTNITEVATFGSNVLCMVVPPGRSREVYVGTNSGEIYRSLNQGATFANVPFTGDGVGTVNSLSFAGKNGDVLWLLHNDSGPRGRILRDLSGGNGGSDVRVEVGYTDIVTTGIGLNALVACDENTAWAAGEVSGGFPVVIKVS